MKQIGQCGATYRGLGPSVAAILPEAAITYGLFDILKRSYRRWSGREQTGVVPSLTAGVLAAFIGQVVAYPLETVSRRMQVRLRSSHFCHSQRCNIVSSSFFCIVCMLPC